MTDAEITEEKAKINRGGYGSGNRKDLQDRHDELTNEENQREEEARRRKENEAPIPSDEDAPYEEPVGLPEEVAQTKAPAGSRGKIVIGGNKPAISEEKKRRLKKLEEKVLGKQGEKGEQLQLDIKRSAQAAKLMKDAAQARRAMKGGKAGMDLLKALRSGLTKGAGIPIELLSIIAGPTMRAAVEEAEDKTPKGT